jgi:hypothetical protein
VNSNDGTVTLTNPGENETDNIEIVLPELLKGGSHYSHLQDLITSFQGRIADFEYDRTNFSESTMEMLEFDIIDNDGDARRLVFTCEGLESKTYLDFNNISEFERKQPIGLNLKNNGVDFKTSIGGGVSVTRNELPPQYCNPSENYTTGSIEVKGSDSGIKMFSNLKDKCNGHVILNNSEFKNSIVSVAENGSITFVSPGKKGDSSEITLPNLIQGKALEVLQKSLKDINNIEEFSYVRGLNNDSGDLVEQIAIKYSDKFGGSNEKVFALSQNNCIPYDRIVGGYFVSR